MFLKMSVKMFPPQVNYAFHKINAELQERLSELISNYQVQAAYSQDKMAENMSYEFSIRNNQDTLGTVSLTMGGIEVALSSDLQNVSTVLQQEFSAENFRLKFDAYKKEYDTIQTEISQKIRKLPPLKEIAELGSYAERLEGKHLPFNVYVTYAMIRDGWTGDYEKRGLSKTELSEIKALLEEVLNTEDPEILTLEEKLRPKKRKQ